MNNRKVIIWGHKFPNDTYFYIQNAYHKDHHTYVSRLKTMFFILV